MSGNKTIAMAMGTDMILGRLSVADHSCAGHSRGASRLQNRPKNQELASKLVVPLYATGGVHCQLALALLPSIRRG